MNHKELLLSGDINKVYKAYLLPTILAMITGSIYVIVDVLFVAVFLGSDALAAFNIGMPVYTLYSAISLLFGVGASTTMSILMGRNDTENSNKVFSFAIIGNLTIGISIAVVGTIFLEPLSIALGATEELLPLVKSYLFPIHSTCFVYILNQCMQVIVRADYNPKLVMLAAVLGNVTNIVLDYVFVVELKWGLFGASFATAIGPFVAIFVLSFHYILKKHSTKFIFKCFDKELFKEVFKNGSGTSILEFSSGSVVFFFNFVLLRVSDSDAVAIYAIISNIAYIGKGLFNGVSQAAQPIISVNFGAGNFDRLEKAFKIALRTAIIISVITYALIILFPRQIMSVFIGNYEHLLEESVSILIIYFISLVFTGINTIIMYYFQSTGNSKISSIMSIMRGFVLIIVGLAIFAFSLGEIGVWITISFAEIVTLIGIIPVKKRYDKYLKERCETMKMINN